ncbi:MAG: hypothetical protein QME81_10940 [bacterium]|nr:hypothetical protein [bacterium]
MKDISALFVASTTYREVGWALPTNKGVRENGGQCPPYQNGRNDEQCLNLQSSLRNPQSKIRNPQSAIQNPQFTAAANVP